MMQSLMNACKNSSYYWAKSNWFQYSDPFVLKPKSHKLVLIAGTHGGTLYYYPHQAVGPAKIEPMTNGLTNTWTNAFIPIFNFFSIAAEPADSSPQLRWVAGSSSSGSRVPRSESRYKWSKVSPAWFGKVRASRARDRGLYYLLAIAILKSLH